MLRIISSILELIQLCLHKRVWDTDEPPVVRLCVRLDSSGITGLHIEAQSRESVNMPVTGICPQCCES